MSGPGWKILLSPPEVGPDERRLLLDAFDSNWVAPAGPDIDAFEAELGTLTGAAAVVALSSGTAALHLALDAVGVGPGDEVLVSTLTFGASAFAVTYVGARPVFVDCEAGSWQLDTELVEAELDERARAGRLPAAVLSVDLYGSVSDGARLAALCGRYDVPLVQDAAEAVGARRDGVHAGRHGRVGVLSFNGNKMVTTGGGGALLSDDPAIVDRVRYLTTQARMPVPWYEHTDIGFNYRMVSLNAAVGRGQLRTLPARIAGRRAVRERYEERLSGAGISFQTDAPGCEPNHWLTTVAVDEATFGAGRDAVLGVLHDAGVEARHGFKPMHLQPVFRGHDVIGGAVAAELFERSVSLPSASRLTSEQVDWICDLVLAAGRAG